MARESFKTTLECGGLGELPAQVFYEYTPPESASRFDPGSTELFEIVSVIVSFNGVASTVAGKNLVQVTDYCQQALREQAKEDWKARMKADLIDAGMEA